MPEAGHVTRLLREADQGNAQATNDLYRLVEEDLLVIAHSIKRKAGIGPGMDPLTMDLVDETFMRLVGQGAADWQPGDRRKFFGYMAKQIHDYLIDELRKQRAKKRGGGRRLLPIGDREIIDSIQDNRLLDFEIDLREALLRYEKFAPDDAALFRTRFFLGFTFRETADVMGVPKTEAVRSCQRTLLRLQKELKKYGQELKEFNRDP